VISFSLISSLFFFTSFVSLFISSFLSLVCSFGLFYSPFLRSSLSLFCFFFTLFLSSFHLHLSIRPNPSSAFFEFYCLRFRFYLLLLSFISSLICPFLLSFSMFLSFFLFLFFFLVSSSQPAQWLWVVCTPVTANTSST
jgi:hypothetical protein